MIPLNPADVITIIHQISGKLDWYVWDLYLLVFQIANGGIYPVEINTLAFNDDNYRNEFTKERIR